LREIHDKSPFFRGYSDSFIASTGQFCAAWRHASLCSAGTIVATVSAMLSSFMLNTSGQSAAQSPHPMQAALSMAAFMQSSFSVVLTVKLFHRRTEGNWLCRFFRPDHDQYHLEPSIPTYSVRVFRGHDDLVPGWYGALLSVDGDDARAVDDLNRCSASNANTVTVPAGVSMIVRLTMEPSWYETRSAYEKTSARKGSDA
jgi:hypothetical protein